MPAGDFQLEQYLIRPVYDREHYPFLVCDPRDGSVLWYWYSFSALEESHLCRDEAERQELLTIKVGSGFSRWCRPRAARDSATGELLGTICDRSPLPWVNDQVVLDPTGKRICDIRRRARNRAVPHTTTTTFTGVGDGLEVCCFTFTSTETTGWRRQELLADFAADRSSRLDRRLGLAAAFLVCELLAVEPDELPE